MWSANFGEIYLSYLQCAVLLLDVLSLSSAQLTCLITLKTFYKKEVESDIKTEPSKNAEERLKMMELLRRFEEDNAQDDSLLLDEAQDEDEDDYEGSGLVQKFQNIDLENTPSDAVWSMLSKDEQAKFITALGDPSSELVQQLLASEELDNDRREPWWEASLDGDEDVDVDTSSSFKRFGPRPRPMTVPISMVRSAPTGPPLIYNLCAMFIAYSYVTRRLATSPLGSLRPGDIDHQEAVRLTSQLVPFVADKKATTLHTSLSSVVTDIWSRFDDGTITSQTFSILLHDTATLIRPLSLTLVSPTSSLDGVDVESHPHCNSILAISDIFDLYSSQPTAGKKPSHVSHKLLFYAAHILSTPSLVLRAFADEIEARSFTIRQDGASEQLALPAESVPPRPENKALASNEPPRVALIEDI